MRLRLPGRNHWHRPWCYGAVAWELLVRNPVSGSTPEVLRFTVPLIYKPLTTHFLETIEHYTLRS